MMNYIELIGRLLGFHRYCFFVLALHFFNAKMCFFLMQYVRLISTLLCMPSQYYTCIML